MVKHAIALVLAMLSVQASGNTGLLGIDRSSILAIPDAKTFEIPCVEGAQCYFGKITVQANDISVPSVRRSQCERESQLATKAKDRFDELLSSASEITVVSADGRPFNYYGRMGAIIYADGENIAEILIREQHARPFKKTPYDWC